MKEKLTYFVVFLFAVAVSITAVVYFHKDFVKIFKLETSDSEQTVKEIPKIDLAVTPSEKIDDFIKYKVYGDSSGIRRGPAFTVLPDTVIVEKYRDSTALRELKEIKSAYAKLESEMIKKNSMLAQRETEVTRLKKTLSQGSDSTFIAWKKNTTKLLESMDAKRAASILSQYSEDTARSLIYSMNKKKAAEILTNLNAETATRLTRLE